MSTVETVERLLHDADHTSRKSTSKSATLAAPDSFEWLFILTGGLAFALPVIFWLGETKLGSKNVIHWYFWAGTLISSPHVYATYVRLHRKIREGQTAWWMGFPCYFVAVALLVLASYLGSFVHVMTAVNIWQSWHYLRQTYGVSCLYGRQHEFDEVDRRIRYWAYHLVFPYLILGRWDMLFDIWGGKASSAIIPVHLGPVIMEPLWIVALAGFYAALCGEVRLMWRNGTAYRPYSMICYLLCIGVHFYGFLVASHYQRGFFAITIFHAVQYLALVWHTERATAATQQKRWAVSIPNLIGFMLFWAILYGIGYSYEQQVAHYISSWFTHASTFLLAAISVHHYFVDTFIWRRTAGR